LHLPVDGAVAPVDAKEGPIALDRDVLLGAATETEQAADHGEGVALGAHSAFEVERAGDGDHEFVRDFGRMDKNLSVTGGVHESERRIAEARLAGPPAAESAVGRA